MLFISYEFLLYFLPFVLVTYYALAGAGWQRGAIAWLILASLFFYGYWNPSYLILLLSSIVVNYHLGSMFGLGRSKRSQLNPRTLLILGISFNLGLLGYFKYANFFVDNINILVATNFHLSTILLPLAISFFTFQQITFLVDAYRDATHEYNFMNYCLFVTFFPQLIAGPIVYHKEMMPQFGRPGFNRFNLDQIGVGFAIFTLGLFKKVVLADGLSVYASPVFDAAAIGVMPTFIDGWVAALAYTFQLYFDFSGYSDMAIGIARMFGIRLPLNFYSPYKASNIIDFWRCWHMTLSRFLRDYVYIPLGGNRKGHWRHHINIMITMLLGGLWHGAGWTFIIWGGLHGAYLAINHAFRHMRKLLGQDLSKDSFPGRLLGGVVTFLAVVIGWVFFRAEGLDAALLMLQGMVNVEEIKVPTGNVVNYLLAAMFITWGMPNTAEYLRNFHPVLDDHQRTFIAKNNRIVWRPGLLTGTVTGVILFVWLNQLFGTVPSEFLYFNF